MNYLVTSNIWRRHFELIDEHGDVVGTAKLHWAAKRCDLKLTAPERFYVIENVSMFKLRFQIEQPDGECALAETKGWKQNLAYNTPDLETYHFMKKSWRQYTIQHFERPVATIKKRFKIFRSEIKVTVLDASVADTVFAILFTHLLAEHKRQQRKS